MMVSSVRHSMVRILCVVLCVLGALQAAVGGRVLPAEVLEMPVVISREDMVKIAGYGEDKLSTVLVTGSVLCQDQEAVMKAYGARAWNVPGGHLPVSGALVAVNCKVGEKGGRRRPCWTRGATDENGEFSIDLPSHLHAIPFLERKCWVRLLRIPNDSSCGPTYLHGRRPIKLWSTGDDGVRTYSAGTIQLVKSRGETGSV